MSAVKPTKIYASDTALMDRIAAELARCTDPDGRPPLAASVLATIADYVRASGRRLPDTLAVSIPGHRLYI